MRSACTTLFSAIMALTATSAKAQQGLIPFDKRFVLEFTECSVARLEMNSGTFSTVNGAPVALICEAGGDLALSCVLQAQGGSPSVVQLHGGKSTTQAIVKSDDTSFQIIVNLTTGTAMMRSDFEVQNGQLRGVKTCSGRYLQEGQSEPAKETPALARPKRLV